MGEVDETVVDEKLRARILACAIAAGALDDEALTNANALSLFAGRELVLRGSRLTDRGLRLATAACAGRLLELDLSRCVGRVSDAGVTRLLRRSPALRRLNISHCRFTDASVECASQSCPQLVEIVGRNSDHHSLLSLRQPHFPRRQPRILAWHGVELDVGADALGHFADR